MSSLKALEKKRFEDLFEMANGYVLDYTNATFADLFRESARVDIFDNKYSIHGTSKAKRLRAFWEQESDPIVGKVLSDLLDVYKYQNNLPNNSKSTENFQECRSIANRLLGKTTQMLNPEKEFLERTFGPITIQNLYIDVTLTPVLEDRLKEAKLCLRSGAPLSVILQCGSILEGILLGVATKNPQKFNQAPNSPKGENKKVKPLFQWTLAQLIDVAFEIGFLGLDVKKFSHSLRDFRNYIHPYKQLSSKFNPDIHTAKICLQVLKAAIADLIEKTNYQR